jgi:Flp pilus assembly protein TadD
LARYRSEILISLVLIAATLLVYGRTAWGGFDFVSYDDMSYVVKNPDVQAGLTADSVRWDLTTTRLSSWHPLTWMSWQLDTELYGGVKPSGFHLTNLLLHLANGLLLFWFLRDLTGAVWRSALVAGLFAVHPIHVESVAWVSERKDVLSTLFWILALWAYLYYARRPSVWRYLGVLLAFALGLMAKPMVVTLPCVLLLLDYWPLGRWAGHPGPAGGMPASARWLILEKLPLFALAVGCSAITIYGHGRDGALESLERYPLLVRVENSLVAYVAYLGKLFWPSNLAVFYPHPGANLPLWKAAGAGLLLAGLSAVVLRERQRRPYLLVGWLWYVITLLPVIGLVVTGGRAMADRYAYVPFLGLYLMVAWGLGELAARGRALGRVIAMAAALGLAACALLASIQVGYWHDGKTLWEHTLKATDDNYLAHSHLGIHLVDEAGRAAAANRFREAEAKRQEAAYHFREAVRLNPDVPQGHYHLALVLDGESEVLARQGKVQEARAKADDALEQYREAVRLRPHGWEWRTALGEALEQRGKLDDALAEYREALRLNPDNGLTHCNVGTILARQGIYDEAIEQFREALRLDPDLDRAHHDLGEALRHLGRWPEAVTEYRQALRINPDSEQAYFNLGLTLGHLGELEEAIDSMEHALRLADARKRTRMAEEIRRKWLPDYRQRLLRLRQNRAGSFGQTQRGGQDGDGPPMQPTSPADKGGRR